MASEKAYKWMKTFSSRSKTCPIFKLYNMPIPQENKFTYLGIHLHRRLTSLATHFCQKYVAEA